MNEESLIDLAEAMLNEGINEDSIISVLSSLVEKEEEVLPVSESCFDSIVSLTEAIINEYNSLNEASKLRAIMNKVGEKVGLAKSGLRGAKNVDEIKKVINRKGKQIQKAEDTVKQKEIDYKKASDKSQEASDKYKSDSGNARQVLSDKYREAYVNHRLLGDAASNFDGDKSASDNLKNAQEYLSKLNKEPLKGRTFANDKKALGAVEKANKSRNKKSEAFRNKVNKEEQLKSAVEKKSSVERGTNRVLPRALEKGSQLSRAQDRSYYNVKRELPWN